MHFHLPRAATFERVFTSFSPSEKILFWGLTGLLVFSTLGLIAEVNDSILIETEARGGSFAEGILGSPRFINPVLALSDADRDLVSLIYSGLMRPTADGSLSLDLAESYTVSEDGLVYDFTIKDNALFHDGTPVTADDVIFTIGKTLDPTLKSAQRANWDGVRVEKISDHSIRFTLARPYAPFLQNTTLGILPKHLWEDIDAEQLPFSQFNVEPVGSGPYRIKKIAKDSSGIPETYILDSFKEYVLGRPFINSITLHFYKNESDLIVAFNKGRIDALNSISPEHVSELEDAKVSRTPLLRIFGVFFNQNTAQIFSHIEVRKALDIAANKTAIVEQVLAGYGTEIDSPIPPGSIGRTTVNTRENGHRGNIEEARDILDRNGWTFDEEEGVWVSEDDEPLRFSLSTSNVTELKSAAYLLKEVWNELGAQVEVKVFEAGNLNQNVIRPREYDALLFGEVIGRELDLFAFWHASQRNDPGLNIAQYANITADALLERGRTTLDREARDEVYLQFEDEVRQDIPAVFLYSPDFIYVLPEKIRGADLGSITTSADRFMDVHQWFIRTDKVWSIFSR
ncbi:MAG: ABC transporter substrate-binding protein [Candidatus Pacebacteria bacterium]|nr:ABC transporter substrate-binding protein [Candidatus Paceibacterota bacterium]